MGSLGVVVRQVTDVAPDCLQLPAETLRSFAADVEGKQLINQTRHQVGTHCETSRGILLPLTLKPGPLQKGLVGKNL
jgi:hypothetical protein